MTSSALSKQTLYSRCGLAAWDSYATVRLTLLGHIGWLRAEPLGARARSEKDTEHEGDQGHQTHDQAQVAHAVLALRLGQPVGERRLQAHKQHAGGEGHSCAHVVKHFSVVHLQETHTREEKAHVSRQYEQMIFPS